jgi:hypothetical protein
LRPRWSTRVSIALGEQAHRALQDVLVVLGRFLGFETAFGTYQRADGTARHHGLWRSRRRLTVVLDLFTDQTPRTDFDDLSKELAALGRDSRSIPKPRPSASVS